MNTDKNKNKKNVDDDKATKSKGIKEKKNKEGRFEGLDQGFITKWLI